MSIVFFPVELKSCFLVGGGGLELLRRDEPLKPIRSHVLYRSKHAARLSVVQLNWRKNAKRTLKYPRRNQGRVALLDSARQSINKSSSFHPSILSGNRASSPADFRRHDACVGLPPRSTDGRGDTVPAVKESTPFHNAHMFFSHLQRDVLASLLNADRIEIRFEHKAEAPELFRVSTVLYELQFLRTHRHNRRHEAHSEAGMIMRDGNHQVIAHFTFDRKK